MLMARVVLLRQTRISLMKVSGENQIDPSGSEPLDSGVRIEHHVLVAKPRSGHQGVMKDGDLEALVSAALDLAESAIELGSPHAPTLERPVERGVDPDHHHLGITKDRLEVCAEVTTIGTVGSENPLPDAVQGDIVIPRHGEKRNRDGAQILLRLAELAWFGPLSQVAGDDEQIGAALRDELQQRSRGWRLMVRAEVNV